MENRWTGAVLDECRTQGDPVADEVVRKLLADARFEAIEQLMGTLVEGDDPLPAGLPEYLTAFLRDTAAPPIDPGDVSHGQRVYRMHGPEISLILACYALPAAYAARKGVKVLHTTAYLARRPNRRVAETAQMILDVMAPGGLSEHGRGIRSAQKIRLLHASVRQRILAGGGWDTATLGVPINQEDLLGTLMTFSWITLDGLTRMGIKLSPAEKQSYLDAWRCVGSMMGVRVDLIPTTVAEAQALTAQIQARQIDPSDEGREMTAALLGMMEANLPVPGSAAISSGLMRSFLPPAVADGLGVPRHFLTGHLIDHLVADAGLGDDFVEAGPIRRTLFRVVSNGFLRWCDQIDLSGKRTSFRIPDHLRTEWGVSDDPDPTFWELLRASARSG